MTGTICPKPLKATRIARLEELLLGKTTYLFEPKQLINYILNSYGFYKKHKTFPFSIWDTDNQAILHLYRASVRNRRQLHIRSVKHTYWGPKSGRKSSKKTAYVYRQHSGKQKTFSSGASEIRKSEDQIDGSYHSEPIKRIQSLAENVRDEIISLEEVKPILHDIAQEMVQGVIEGSEEKLLKFVELVERQQEQLENIPDTIEEIKTIASIANFTEPISRQNSKLSEISAQELSQAFLDNLTDNVSVYLEDILDEVLLYTNERKKADGDNDTIGNEDDVRVVDIADKNSSHNN